MEEQQAPTNDGDNAFASDWQSGLTKREYFAAQALTGLLANSAYTKKETATTKAVEYADALIEALNK
ncbi:hypothetical protein [Spirosoma areae]